MLQDVPADPVTDHGTTAGTRTRGAKRVFVNAVSGAGVRIAMMCVGFLLTPYILRSLGMEAFGLWSVVGSLAGYFGMLDLGMIGTIVRFMTQSLESERRDETRRIFSFAVAFYAAFALALTLVAYVASPYVTHLLSMPAADYGLATAVFRALFAILLANIVLGMPAMLLVSMHRMDLTNRNAFFGYLVYVVTTVALLREGRGIWAVVIAQGAQVLFSTALQYRSARRMFGPLWANPFALDRATVKALLGFGGWTQLNAILSVINIDVGRFIAAGAISVSSVTYYELGSKIAFISKLIPGYFLDAIMPAAAAADAQRNERMIERMYASGSLYFMFLTLAVAGFLVGSGPALLRVWLGSVYPYVPLIILCLASGYAVNSMVSVGTVILRASGKPRYETYYTAVGTLANIAGTIAFAPRFGIVGVAMGSAIGWFAASAFFLVVFHRIAKVSWWATVGPNSLRLLASTAACTAALAVVLHAPPVAKLFASKIEGLAVLSVASALFLAVLLAVTLLVRVWSPADIAFARRLFGLDGFVRRKAA